MMKRALALLLPLALVGCQEAAGPLLPDQAGGEAVLSRGTASVATYSITDLGTLGGNASFGLGLNNRGQAVGNSRTTTSARPLLAFLWERGEMTNLGSLPGSTFSRAFSINERGVAVGEAFTAPSPEISRAVKWENGRITDLGTLGSATGAVANDINNRGQIAGVSGSRAVLWERGRIRDLGAISDAPEARSRGNAINERGQVVGWANTDILNAWGGRVSHAFLWDRGRMIDLGTLGDPTNFSVALGINERAEVVGEAHIGGSTYHAWVWRHGEMTSIHPAELGLRHSRANAINAPGQIVGHVSGFWGFATIDGRAVLWQGGAAFDLNDLVPEGSGWVLRSAEGISDRGQIVGYGSYQGQTRAFLLTPNE